MREWIQLALLAFVVLILLEARIRVGTKVAVIERDLEWIRGTLTKWGMVVPDAKKS